MELKMENKIAKFIFITGIIYVVLSILGGFFIISEVDSVIGFTGIFISLGFSLVFFGGAELIELNDKQVKELKKMNQQPSKNTYSIPVIPKSQISFEDLPKL